MRLFLSISLNDELRGDLAAVVDELRRRASEGRFTLPENLHLTLAFLGECDQYQLDVAISAMNELHFEPFDLRIEGMGTFKQRGGDLWWAGVQKCDELMTLQRDLARELRQQGFELEQRKYKPHITLGRQIHLPQHSQGGLIGVSAKQQVNSFELMQSDRIGNRLNYTTLYTRHAME